MRLVVHNDAALCCVLAVSENGSSWRNVLKPTDLYWRRSQCFYKCAICAVGTSVCLFMVVAVNVYVCVAPLTGFPAVCRLCLAGCYFISFSFYFFIFFLFIRCFLLLTLLLITTAARVVVEVEFEQPTTPTPALPIASQSLLFFSTNGMLLPNLHSPIFIHFSCVKTCWIAFLLCVCLLTTCYGFVLIDPWRLIMQRTLASWRTIQQFPVTKIYEF